MENDRIMLAALIFLLLIAGANLIMYGLVRSVARGEKGGWVNTLRNSLHHMRQSRADHAMDELRKKVTELQQNNDRKGE